MKCFVILTDAQEFAAFNKVYATYFPQDPPARTTLEAKLMIDIKVEIEAIGQRSSGPVLERVHEGLAGLDLPIVPLRQRLATVDNDRRAGDVFRFVGGEE